MAKVKLGNAPKSFKHTVKFTQLDGSKAEIKVEYRYRTRQQFSDLLDGMVASAKDAEPTGDDAFKTSVVTARTQAQNVEYMLEILDSWDLDDELNRENLLRLCNEFPAAAASLMAQYHVAVTEGRLGN